MRTVVIAVLLAVLCAGSSLSFAASHSRTHQKAAPASQSKSKAHATKAAADDDTPAPRAASRKSKAKSKHASGDDAAPARVSRKSRKAAASDDDAPAPTTRKSRRAAATQDDAAPARVSRKTRKAAAASDDDTPAPSTRKTRRAAATQDDAGPARVSRKTRKAAAASDDDAPAPTTRKSRRAAATQDDDDPPVRSSRRSRRGRFALRKVDLERTRSSRRALLADPAPAPASTRTRTSADDAAASVPGSRTTPEGPALPAPTNSIPMHAPIVAMAPLRGSMESLVRQNEKTDADNLERIEDDTDLDHRIAQGMLVPVPASAALTVNSGLPQNRRYCRPWTASFLADLARAHQAQFHHAFFVSSAVRTVEYQKRLIRTNGNAAAAEGDVASPHLTGATIDIAKNGMSRQELYWMRNRLDALQEEGKIDVEEEFKQACFHITVYKSYIGAGPLHKPHHAAPSDAAGAQDAPIGPPTDGE